MLRLKEAQAKRYLDPAGKPQYCLGYIGNKYFNYFQLSKLAPWDNGLAFNSVIPPACYHQAGLPFVQAAIRYLHLPKDLDALSPSAVREYKANRDSPSTGHIVGSHFRRFFVSSFTYEMMNVLSQPLDQQEFLMKPLPLRLKKEILLYLDYEICFS